jgi:hypothetical protein
MGCRYFSPHGAVAAAPGRGVVVLPDLVFALGTD